MRRIMYLKTSLKTHNGEHQCAIHKFCQQWHHIEKCLTMGYIDLQIEQYQEHQKERLSYIKFLLVVVGHW